ncbi:MAG: Gfo/Idh/MocA family protein [Candidatus Bathyarchaeia archaeon]
MKLSTRTVNWGVLGTAGIATKFVIPAIEKSINGKVVAIASRDKDRAHRVAKSYGLRKCYGDYGELLDSPDIDAVYVPLPNSLHCEWTIRAAEAGLHVLCEKPLAPTAEECERMISACRKNDVILMEGFMYRYHPQIVMLQRLVDSELVGRILVIRSEFTVRLEEYSRNFLDDIRYQKNLGGGSLLDLGCYCVDITRLLTKSEPDHVAGQASIHKEKQIDETFAGIMHFPGNELALFESSFLARVRHNLEIIGTKGHIELPAAFEPGYKAEIGIKTIAKTERIQFHSVNPYQLMVEEFASSVLNGREPSIPATTSIGNMKAIEMLLKSASNSTVN